MNNKMITSPTTHHPTHTQPPDTHVEVFTLQAVVPSLCPQCVITVLLSPCGSVMTEYGAGTERGSVTLSPQLVLHIGVTAFQSQLPLTLDWIEKKDSNFNLKLIVWNKIYPNDVL